MQRKKFSYKHITNKLSTVNDLVYLFSVFFIYKSEITCHLCLFSHYYTTNSFPYE